jgi:hypothetical protein
VPARLAVSAEDAAADFPEVFRRHQQVQHRQVPSMNSILRIAGLPK